MLVEDMYIEMKIVDSSRLRRGIKCIKRRNWRCKARHGYTPRYRVKI